MQTPEIIAQEWERIYRAKQDLRTALTERGVSLPKDAPLEAYAPKVRSEIPTLVEIYKEQQFFQTPQERLPKLTIAGSYSPVKLAWLFGRCPNLLEAPEVIGIERASSLHSLLRESRAVRGALVLPDLPVCLQMDSLVRECSNIQSVTIGDAPICEDVNYLAAQCTQLQSLTIGALPVVRNIEAILYLCPEIERFETHFGDKITSAAWAFNYCTKLREITGVIDLTKVTNLNSFISECPALEEVRLKGIQDNLILHQSTHLSLESVRYLITEAQQVTGKTIYLSRKLTERHPSELVELGKAANAKGWTISYR
jgi:hypothetical protein